MAREKKPTINEIPRKGDDRIYVAHLTVGDKKVASITIRATDDDDAKSQLIRSKPSYFEGMGEWALFRLPAPTKVE